MKFVLLKRGKFECRDLHTERTYRKNICECIEYKGMNIMTEIEIKAL
jgi:hypothetical protein